MQCREARGSQRWWDDNTVFIEDNAITAVQMSPELVVFSDGCWELVFELWKSIFYSGEEEEHVLI